MCYFSLATLNIFSLTFSFTMICLFFYFYIYSPSNLLRFLICRLFYSSLGSFQSLFHFSFGFFLFFFYYSINVGALNGAACFSKMVLIFHCFFFCSLSCIMSIHLCSDLLILYSARSNLLLNLPVSFYCRHYTFQRQKFHLVLSIGCDIIIHSFIPLVIDSLMSLNIFIITTLNSVKSDIWLFSKAISLACFFPLSV